MSLPSSGCLHCHFLHRFHRPDHFRLCFGFCWKHFHVTSLETFHEMLPHFWLIPVLRCRVYTTANYSGICNCEEAPVTTSSLLCKVLMFGHARVIESLELYNSHAICCFISLVVRPEYIESNTFTCPTRHSTLLTHIQ